jgi:hypothetical protein
VDGDDFKDWYKSSEVIDNVVRHTKEYKDQYEFNWGNVLHIVAGLLDTDFEQFLETYKKPIYYNPILTSLKSDERGKVEAELAKDLEKYFEIDLAVEPNKLLFNMDKLLNVKKVEKVKKEKQIKATQVKVEPTNTPVKIASVSVLDKEGDKIYQNSLSVNSGDDNLLSAIQNTFSTFANTWHTYFNEDTQEWEVVNPVNNTEESLLKHLQTIFNPLQYT